MAAACRLHRRPRAPAAWTTTGTAFTPAPPKSRPSPATSASRWALPPVFPACGGFRTIRRVRRLVTEPLFPALPLLPLRPRPSVSGGSIHAQDVVAIVSFGGVPAVVDDALIEELRAWAGDVVDVDALQPGLKAARPGRNHRGLPCAGLQAVIRHPGDGRERVAIVLSILERNVQTRISREQLVRLD